jgi:hypothetical protein
MKTVWSCRRKVSSNKSLLCRGEYRKRTLLLAEEILVRREEKRRGEERRGKKRKEMRDTDERSARDE